MMRGLEKWLHGLRRRPQRPVENPLGTRHVLIALCNRLSSVASEADKSAMVRRWIGESARLREEFPAAQAFSLKHTFSLPPEEASAAWAPELAALCRVAGCEIELAPPRDAKSAAGLRRERIEAGKERLAQSGWLGRDRSGAARFCFVHRAEGSSAFGLGDQAGMLRDAGCAASFPFDLKPGVVPEEFENSLVYFLESEAAGPRQGLRRVRAERETRGADRTGLLVAPPPFCPEAGRKTFGFKPEIDQGEIGAAALPTADRLHRWLDCRLTVEARPNWLFVVLHTDGFSPENASMLFGEPMRDFHRKLRSIAARDRTLCLHGVTARELVNILHAAEAGHSGNPLQFCDFRYLPPPAIAESRPSCGAPSEKTTPTPKPAAGNAATPRP